MRCVQVFVFLLVVQTGLVFISADRKILFASINSMIQTLQSEQALLKAVQNYFLVRQSKLGVIIRVYDRWEHLHYETQRSLRKNKTDSVARFKLIQRITRYWGKFKTDFLNKSGDRENLTLTYQRALIPDSRDLRGISRLLIVNSDIYKKPFCELLSPRSQYLTVDEMLELSFQIKQHSLGVSPHDTLLKASRVALYGLTEFNSSELTISAARLNFLSVLTDELYGSGLWNLGYALCQDIRELFPGNEEFVLKEKLYSYRLNQTNSMNQTDIPKDLPAQVRTQEKDDKDAYAACCNQRELLLSPDPELKCYYFHKNSHLRHIAAHKVEEVSKRPDIRLYHDVLYDREIHLMKNMAFPLLNAAEVYNHETKSPTISDYRISNNGWFYDPDRSAPQHPAVEALYRKLNQRLEDCTALDKKGVESIQMNNYGVGGHYVYHYDALFYNKIADDYPNDRVATWMYYLNDVTEGGNTVFPRLNISIPPKRGSAVFWYNLHPSGELDRRTLHGGCPILRGTKWVANMWIYEFEQMFVRPCSLLSIPQEDSS